MRIIISPAKKMSVNTDNIDYRQLPRMLNKTEILLQELRKLEYDDLKKLWNCNDKIAQLNYERIQHMDLQYQLTPAILAYEGIQYQYMAPQVFEHTALEYIENHVRILSGFYGILRPLDGITPYRLEMQAKMKVQENQNLYEFWAKNLAEELCKDNHVIINLASKEYSKCIVNNIDENTKFITCIFGEYVNNKVVEKATQVKMARGEMVRFMAENQISEIEDMKGFKGRYHRFVEGLSSETTLVFIKE